MSNTRLNISDLRAVYIGNQYYSLSVLDVIRNESDVVCFVCKCECGNIVNIPYRQVLRGCKKSCGCRSNVATRISIDSLKDEYIGKVYNKLTVVDVFRKTCNNHHVIMFKCKCECGSIVDIPKKQFHKNPPASCGCYKRTKEFIDKQIQWRMSNQDKVAAINQKISQWYKDNQDRVKEKTEQWHSTYDSKACTIAKSLLDRHTEIRSDIVNYIDTSLIHKDDLHLVNEGCISSTQIRTRCPLCGNYEYHRLYHVINYKDRYMTNRLCSKCAFSLTSSKYEQVIADYVQSFYSGEHIKNSRTVIPPLELDLYYPEKKIAIEFNGDYWHDENHKPKDYHYNKFKSCLDKGILLASIFESEWVSHSTEIKNYLYCLFNNEKTELSFLKEGYMNNNYPSIECLTSLSLGNFTEDYYNSKDAIVYTCGYSEILC